VILSLAWASLVRHRARTLLAVAGVAISAAMLLDMVMLASGMRVSFRSLLLAQGFQIRLAPRGTLPFDTDATIPGATAIMSQLKARRDVVAVSPVLGAQLHVERGAASVSAAALGTIAAVQGDYKILTGRAPTIDGEAAANDALLSATTARLGDVLAEESALGVAGAGIGAHGGDSSRESPDLGRYQTGRPMRSMSSMAQGSA